MKFPGRRKSKHYFPVEEKGRLPLDFDVERNSGVYIVGVDQLIVDIEAHVAKEFLDFYDIPHGQSVVLKDELINEIYQRLKEQDRIVGEFAGGSVGNTLHNFSVLSDSKSVVLGTICNNISVGDYPFKYLCHTSYHVDLTNLKPCEGHMARAMAFVTPDGERTFALSKGIMNDLTPDYISEDVIRNSAALLVSTYLLRDPESSMYQSVIKAVNIAKEFSVPVVLSLGTSQLVGEMREFLTKFIKDYVNVLAMNEQEAYALVGLDDPLLASEEMLEWTDLVLLTVGARGLYICGHVDAENARETEDMTHSKSISEYNKYEYSRAQFRKNCDSPVKIYTHINPFLGGPGTITNTNGAGDAALSALLHDMTANIYHKRSVPNSPKHQNIFLTYSSIHQISKYANRVSFEVLNQNSPRLRKGLPAKEDCLEDGYWAQ